MAARSSPTGFTDRDAVESDAREEGLESSLWACPCVECAYTVRLWKPAGSLYRPTCPDHPEVLCAPWDGKPRVVAARAPKPPPTYPEPL